MSEHLLLEPTRIGEIMAQIKNTLTMSEIEQLSSSIQSHVSYLSSPLGFMERMWLIFDRIRTHSPKVVFSNHKEIGLPQTLIKCRVTEEAFRRWKACFVLEVDPSKQIREIIIFWSEFPSGYAHIFVHNNEYEYLEFSTTDSFVKQHQQSILSRSDINALSAFFWGQSKLQSCLGLHGAYWTRNSKGRSDGTYYSSETGNFDWSYKGNKFKIITVADETPIIS